MVTFKCPHCGCTEVLETTLVPCICKVKEFNRDGSVREYISNGKTDEAELSADFQNSINPEATPLKNEYSLFKCSSCGAVWHSESELKTTKALVETRHRMTKAYYDELKRKKANGKKTV